MTKKSLKNNVNYHLRIKADSFVLTRNELLKRIFDETLAPSTKVRKENELIWLCLNETAEWNLFHGSAREQQIWVLLIRANLKTCGKEKKPVFWQKGPYSTKQVSFFLKEGLCSDRDFIWREPFKEWQKISLVPEFSTHPAQTIKDLLAQQNRKYSPKPMKMIRYFASAPSLNWSEWQKMAQKI